MAATPGVCPTRRASSAYSPSDEPAIDTIGRASCCSSQGRSRARNASMPGPLQADRVEHPRRRLGHPRRRPARPRVAHDRLRDDRAELGDVEELLELSTGRCAPAGGHHRVDEMGVGEDGRQVDVVGASSQSSMRRRPSVRRLPAARRSVPAGTVPTASHRTLSPAKTGPSTQERTIRITPSSPRPAARTSCRRRSRRPSTPRPPSGSTHRAPRATSVTAAQHAHRPARVDDLDLVAADQRRAARR